MWDKAVRSRNGADVVCIFTNPSGLCFCPHTKDLLVTDKLGINRVKLCYQQSAEQARVVCVENVTGCDVGKYIDTEELRGVTVCPSTRNIMFTIYLSDVVGMIDCKGQILFLFEH